MVAAVETMAYAGELPWHGLGVPVSNDLTPEQMLDKAGLNWEVEVRDLFVDGPRRKDGCRRHADQILVPGKKALYRSSDNKFFDVIGSDWKPLQNAEAFEFFNDFVAAGDMEMHTAGALTDGSRVWALAKVNDSFEVFKGDVVEQYLLFSSPHKYGSSIDVKMTPTRVVCWNTLSFALKGMTDYAVKVSHRRLFDAEGVKEQLGVAKEKLDVYKEAAQFLGAKRFTNDSIVDYFNEIFPRTSNKKGKTEPSRNAKEALEVLVTQPGAEFGPGTFWSAFNTVTYMTDHTIGRGVDTRLTSAWYGYNSKLKEKALKKAIEYAEAA